MKYKSLIQSDMNKEKITQAKIIFVGFVLILAFVCFSFISMNSRVVNAAPGSEFVGSIFDKDKDGTFDYSSDGSLVGTIGAAEGTNTDIIDENKTTLDKTDEIFHKYDLTSGGQTLTFIQGNGANNEVALIFNITNFPNDATSFMVVESEKSDSAGEAADADRYSLGNGDDNLGWFASENNKVINGFAGSAKFWQDSEVVNAQIIYRIRKGSFGMKTFTIFFYNSASIDENKKPSYRMDLYYVIAQPIDIIEQLEETCEAKHETKICVEYAEDEANSRISKELKIYIPTSVAYIFKVVDMTTDVNTQLNTIVTNADAVKAGSTIYGMNYFIEDEVSGEVTPSNKDNATRMYMYTNFEMSGDDTQKLTKEFVDDNCDYISYLDVHFNRIAYFKTKVDSRGAFTYYIRDIFGNVKEVVQNVDNVRNRAIIVEIQKGNATQKGYNADETFTNSSVSVQLKMTAETHFEVGICYETGKCTKVIALDRNELQEVKYWRVDVEFDADGNDIDAYEVGKVASDDYASEDHAAEGTMKKIYCMTGMTCEIQEYDSTKPNDVDNGGYSSLEENVLTMYIALSGRYRFYIADKSGNNTWGADNDRIEEEYRNPRVEVYAIDKEAPEITFDHYDDDNNPTNRFDLETYEYYTALELKANADGAFEYDGRITGTEAVEKNIDSKIYYPIVRDDGRSDDKKFTDDDAILLSKVRASEYVYYYNETKDKYADYSLHDRQGSDTYVKKLYDSLPYDNSIATILKNTKHNSTGLKLISGSFEFKEINYYHKDGNLLVCEQLGKIDATYATKDKLDCVNYYIDHGVDFIIEFIAEDEVGNLGTGRVYVNLVDTTAPGYTLHKKEDNTIDADKLIKASNIGTKCRMEIGQEIGAGKNQKMDSILNCYNIDANEVVNATNKYNFEDNVYDDTVNDGLSFANRINTRSYVKLYILSDENADGEKMWIDLSTSTFIPNNTGYYDLKIVIYDNTIGMEGTNSLTILVSYYVDRKIVLIKPVETDKFYGSADPTFHYCVYIDETNNYDVRFSENPYDLETIGIYTSIYCTNVESSIETGKNTLFQQNTASDFGGSLSRLESVWYNTLKGNKLDDGTGVENNYVGLYKFVLGELNIYLKDSGEPDDDYIVKIHPSFRDTENRYDGDSNEITRAERFEDDDSLAQSSQHFTIKQIVLNVSSTGGSKNYGEKDTNYADFNDDSANAYLNGYNTSSVSGLIDATISGIQYNDTTSIILGVLRREVGENVGAYKICNYRGITNEDNLLETKDGKNNDIYVNCDETGITSGVTFNADANNFEGYEYDKGILKVNETFIKSRALYIATNKAVTGKGLNVTTDIRNNMYTNYVINYTAGEYIINSIDLVLQAAPGQRREYNFTNTHDPNPWEIILYGLVDGQIKRTVAEEGKVVAFNGYTADIIAGDYYGVGSENDSSEVALLEANKSESRNPWNLYHEGVQLTGYKTNETYSLLRSSKQGETTAKLVRESGTSGGWYLYYGLSYDLNVVDGTIEANQSKIAVITNGREQCTYDTTGHEVTVGGNALCKNYNLIYNEFYTNADGYTKDNNPNNLDESNFVYKSNGKSCKLLDPDLPCSDENMYKIQFEIYRREIILEFNSAIETLTIDNGVDWDIFYGKRYNFYESKYFDINYYTEFNSTNTEKIYPENYLFLCYQNETEMTKSEFTPDTPNSGCSGQGKYGLTAGDTWQNLGITFKMHKLVSASNSAYYADEGLAIPAGVYYIYSDIAAAQKKNYNFKYLGGTMTIKSLSVELRITSYTKEYGEEYYFSYGEGSNYGSFTSLTNECYSDSWLLGEDTNLISLPENSPCKNDATNFKNDVNNIYGYYIVGLDEKDTIADNFNGRPKRYRSGSDDSDLNGLQDNVGRHLINRGGVATGIRTINNNEFVNESNSCTGVQINKGEYSGDCVVVANKTINNYVLKDEVRNYVFDMIGDDVTASISAPTKEIIDGYLFITPAELTIKVEAGQNKMYGCAYNVAFAAMPGYDYENGYGVSCVQTDGDYYDLGYSYKVSGDKDYQIAKYGYSYTSNDTYAISGIYGTDTFRPNSNTVTKVAGVKYHALNDGTLYRVPLSDDLKAKVNMSTYVSLAGESQTGTSKKYQKQTVGQYILTLGNLDSATNGAGGSTYVNSCDANNLPKPQDEGGIYNCKNYNIDYYKTKVYPSAADVDQTYSDDTGFPNDLIFEIKQRTVYVYTNYDQKIYGEADIYNNDSLTVKYKCGDYNMDGVVDTSDDYEGVNGDVYYGFCSQAQVDHNKEINQANPIEVDYGLTRYYTKYNSLAKYPWNGQETEKRNDVQTDVITGRISRKGMNDNAPNTDDIKGLYDYVYENGKYKGSVHLTETYGAINYKVNYYENNKAVNEKGESSETTVDGETRTIQYEIVLRQIKIAFVSFNKVYGEHDLITDYNILVCAPTEEFDFVNMKCENKDPNDKHGLSATHISTYVDASGKLIQSTFKNDFVVRIRRVLGENVSCGTASQVEVSLNGYFFGSSDEVDLEGTVYTKTLKCNTELVEDKSVYETLAYIDQSTSANPGYNYKVSYQIGYVNIVPRPIIIEPDANQGFVYGDYRDTLIPAITYKDKLVESENDGTVQTYGLVNDVTTGSKKGICLKNIDYYNHENGASGGTCFYINDRIDEYNASTSMSTSEYKASAVNPNTGLAGIEVTPNYVFGDQYFTEGSNRSALNRIIASDSNSTSERYNRNVGEYAIKLGDLADKTGNYTISFKEGVIYKITHASITVTPDAESKETSVVGTTQQGQYKIYGEKDKELTFVVETTYTITHSHYSINDANIIKINREGTDITLANLDKYIYNEETKVFTKSSEGIGQYIFLNKGDVVTLSGFAYGENNGDNHNYGKSQSAKKDGTEQSDISQSLVSGSLHFDIVGNGVEEGVIYNAIDSTLTYAATSRILLGYLYVENWSQAAGVYTIENGFKVAVNQWGNNNYALNFIEDVGFTIIPRPVGVQIQNIEKTYGQATDTISCEFEGSAMIDCSSSDSNRYDYLVDGNTLLKYNFSVENLTPEKVTTILNANSSLYSQNNLFANGMVPETQKVYSAYNTAENKNSEHLGVYVSRDERNTSDQECLYDGDTYGFCEDVGTYALRFYGYVNTIDNISKHNYSTVYKPSTDDYTGETVGVETYYYNSYFGYNPNYFVVVINNSAADKNALTTVFDSGATTTDREKADTSTYTFDKLLKTTGTLTINKKDVALYVNTNYFEEGLEIYYVGQNTNPPSLPLIDNNTDLNYDLFKGLGNYTEANRQEAVSGVDSYGTIIWGTQPAQVRRGDKLEGELAYCNKIITLEAYDTLRQGGLLNTDYTCSDIVYNENKDNVNTNLPGYVPIVRNTNTLSIVNQTTGTANAEYENKNYSVTFYPGALRIEEDNTKPVVQVNRTDVYLEANAIGTYMYECVGTKGTTTYTNCGEGEGISIVGKTSETDIQLGDPILNWLNTSANYQTVIKIDLPKILGCEGANEHKCTSSAYFQLNHGKDNEQFSTSGGILPGVEKEDAFIKPFTMQKAEYIKNGGVNSLKELIITMVDWFGVTAYDQGEVRDGQLLDKKFDKYWYLVIEQNGTNGDFDISKVGEYKVHFYVMDNAGNVSEGNMYKLEDEKQVLETTYTNVGTLHIIDTTKPVVGTLNLYNGRVVCEEDDCTKEENWIVESDTYLPINTLNRFDADGNPKENGEYIDIGTGTLVTLATQKTYSKKANNLSGVSYEEDTRQGRYIKIPAGNNASALKHYSWSNSSMGIYLTITGGSDNSYTVNSFETKNVQDLSQWKHYYSRDGGVTWFLYNKTTGAPYLALDSEGTREIMIKAVDSGVAVTSATAKSATYTEKYYGNGYSNTTKTMTYYEFDDSSVHDKNLATFNDMDEDAKKENETIRTTALAGVKWNVSDPAQEDKDKANKISMMIYGKLATSEDDEVPVSGYTYYRDVQKAYLDRTSPVISFGEHNGLDLYVYEYGCQNNCNVGYTELYAGALDSYPQSYQTQEIVNKDFNKNYSILLNYRLDESKGVPDYTNISEEKISVVTSFGGLGSDQYAMNGGSAGLDIRNVYTDERRYVIYAFNENKPAEVYELSNRIPTSNAEGEDESAIYNIISQTPNDYLATGDYTYEILYSVFDKAGNESVFITRGVIYASLIPTIELEDIAEVVNVEGNDTFSMSVEQGEDIQSVINSFGINASVHSQLLTQTIYFNDELIVDNKLYDENIYDGFSTSTPGVYEITYNLSYKYKGELIAAKPIKLKIHIEATPPIVETKTQVDYSYIIVLLGVLIMSVGACWFSLISRKKK